MKNLEEDKTMRFIFIFAAMLLTVAKASATPRDTKPDLRDEAYHRFEDEIKEASVGIKDAMRSLRVRKLTQSVFQQLRRHDPSMAQLALDGILNEVPALREMPGTWLAQGEIAFWREDYDFAAQSADKVVRSMEGRFGGPPLRADLIPDADVAFVADAYFDRGTAELHSGQFEKAITDIDAAFTVAPRAYMQVNKSRALAALGRYEEAAQAFEAAAFLDAKVVNTSDHEALCRAFSEHAAEPKACL